MIDRVDIEQRISAGVLEQLVDGDESLIDSSVQSAKGIVTNMLSDTYDLVTEFDKLGTNRHENLRIWLVSLACYFLYSRISDNEVPKRISNDYETALSQLGKIAQGKQPTTLTKKIQTDGSVKTAIRYGFNAKKSHTIL